jgi:Zn finger protein HypA/HybF involved in hydrogenase expression
MMKTQTEIEEGYKRLKPKVEAMRSGADHRPLLEIFEKKVESVCHKCGSVKEKTDCTTELLCPVCDQPQPPEGQE